MARVELVNVKKIYQGNVTAVHGFNLDIKDKEFVVFVGPSGCGKSTTLRMIAGLEDISEGVIKIDGEVINDFPPKERGIAMVFQNYALYPHLTVFENMAFPLRLDKKVRTRFLTKEEIKQVDLKIEKLKDKNKDKYAKKIEELENSKKEQITIKGFTQDEIYEKVTSVAKILGITEYLTRKPKALSGGQRQRVAIGRAMVRESKVFLMDEPLSNLDAKLRNQMRAEIILLRKRINTTFVYVTHDQTEAMTLGDRIVIMKNGFIQQVGTPTEVFEMPENLFVAGFIGAPMMNFIRCDLTKTAKGYFVNPFGAKILVDSLKGVALGKKKVKTQQIILGVRPEHITLATKAGPNTFEGKVKVCEMMGSELHLHVDVNDSNIIVRIPTVSISMDLRDKLLVPGSKVRLTFEGKVMHFFNPLTEINLLTHNDRVPSSARILDLKGLKEKAKQIKYDISDKDIEAIYKELASVDLE